MPHSSIIGDVDFIIVGAGSAGCVLANALSAGGRYEVAVLEAGPSDNRFWIKTPIGYGITYTDPSINWCYTAKADPALGGREEFWPRGKVLGGSSSINALVYHRGQARDYDDWARHTDSSWSYTSVQKSFDAFEEFTSPTATTVSPAAADSENGAPKLSVYDASADYHPLKHAFAAAFSELSLPNSGTPPMEGEGLGPYRITTRAGRRCSSASAFLTPAISRKNLHVRKDARVTKVCFEGRRATGVHYSYRGEELTLRARQEVILACGAVNSPQLLEVSGIGSGKLLQTLEIPMILDQPNVGEHLQDHLGINYYYRANRPTLNNTLGHWPGRILAGMRYVITRSGPLALSVNQVGGLARSSPTAAQIDTQIYCNPVSYEPLPGNKRKLTQPHPYAGFILSFNPCRPTSEGSIHAISQDPSIAPSIVTNYLSTQSDLDDVVAMARLIGRMQETTAIKNILASAPERDLPNMSDDDLISDFRLRSGTVYHPCGTCRMGKDAATSVVDANLKVHGVDGLRVVDASIFPNITSANTNAPTIMVAHEAARRILKSKRSIGNN